MYLNNAQLAIWFAQMFDKESSAYNIGEYIKVSDSIDTELFLKAVHSAIDQTDTLHLGIIDTNEEPRQYFANN